jgi:hypothetical protein
VRSVVKLEIFAAFDELRARLAATADRVGVMAAFDIEMDVGVLPCGLPSGANGLREKVLGFCSPFTL